MTEAQADVVPGDTRNPPSSFTAVWKKLTNFWQEIKVTSSEEVILAQTTVTNKAPDIRKEDDASQLSLVSSSQDALDSSLNTQSILQKVSSNQNLIPHKAYYDVRVEKNESDDVSEVQGALTIEIREKDAGWLLTEEATIFVYYTDKTDEKLESTMSCWESNDGLSYNFYFQTIRNGEVDQFIQGKAQKPTKDGAVLVELLSPEEKTIHLHPGVLFPLEYRKNLINAALNKKRNYTARIFDGGDLNLHAQEASSHISIPKTVNFSFNNQDHLFAPKVCYDVSMAFFPEQQTSDMTPEYVINETLFDQGGVSASRTLNYGDLLIKATLRDITVYQSSN
ncbi:MAG TPA: DUF1849 family protein [Alphaproteobacteria bacterium]|nr:DUF1849 family protein [Alphaproteobacteria bacterium]